MENNNNVCNNSKICVGKVLFVCKMINKYVQTPAILTQFCVFFWLNIHRKNKHLYCKINRASFKNHANDNQVGPSSTIELSVRIPLLIQQW